MVKITTNLNHFSQELINLVFSVAKVTTLNKVVGLLSPSPSWSVQLEWPQKVGGILEVGSNSQDTASIQIVPNLSRDCSMTSFNLGVWLEGKNRF